MKTNGNGKRPLPDGWKWTPFGDILEIQGGSQPPKDTFIYEPKDGYIRLLQIRDFGDRPMPTYIPIEEARKICKRDDILIARYGASLGRILTGMEGAYNVAMAKVIFDKKTLHNKYVYYLLQTTHFQTPIHMISRSAQNGFNKGDIYPLDLPIAPLPVQERIVAEIEKQFTRLDTAVSTLNRLQNTLDRYQASLLKAACTGQLLPQDPNDEPAERLLQRILAQRRQRWLETEWQNQIERAQKKAAQAQRKAAGRPHNIRDLDPADWQPIPEAEYAPYLPQNDKWQKKYKEPAAVETADLPDLPPGWVWASLESVSDAQGGYAFRSKDYSDSGYQILKIGNVKMNKLQLDSHPSFIQDVPDSVVEKYLLKRNDIVITLTGTRRKRDYGFVALIKNENDLLLNQRVARLRFSRLLDPDYCLIALQSKVFQDRFFSYETGNVGQGNVGMRAITLEPIAIPPLAEQKRIVAEVERRLSVVTATQQAISANQTRSGRLRQSILQQAFNGRLV